MGTHLKAALFVLEVADAGDQQQLRQRKLSVMAAAAAVGQGPQVVRALLDDALGKLHIMFDQPVLLSSTDCSALVEGCY